MSVYILYYIGWDIIIFLVLCFVYFPVIAFRITIRENSNKTNIKSKQIFIEFIILFVIIDFILSKYWREIFAMGN